jgi:hypothetical protein
MYFNIILSYTFRSPQYFILFMFSDQVTVLIIAHVSDSMKRDYLYGAVHNHLNTNAVLLTNFYLLYMFPQNLSTFGDVLLGIK